MVIPAEGVNFLGGERIIWSPRLGAGVLSNIILDKRTEGLFNFGRISPLYDVLILTVEDNREGDGPALEHGGVPDDRPTRDVSGNLVLV